MGCKNNRKEHKPEDCKREIEDIFDFDFFKTLFEPVRSELLKTLAIYGSQNISEISDRFSQDRSVISRHLDAMHKHGILNKKKESRYIIYELNAPEILERFESTTRKLRDIITKCSEE